MVEDFGKILGDSMEAQRAKKKRSRKSIRLPTNKNFLPIINAEDLFSVVLKGYQCIDDLLSTAISESLPVKHTVELQRLSFPLKADLAVALGVLQPSSRNAFLGLNRIRNLFAHRRDFRFTSKHERDLYNSLGPMHRKLFAKFPRGAANSPEAFLRNCVANLYAESRSMVRRVRDQQIFEAALHQAAEDVIDKRPEAERAREKYGKELDEELRRAIEKARAERAASGEP